jgi:hypothetical protein
MRKSIPRTDGKSKLHGTCLKTIENQGSVVGSSLLGCPICHKDCIPDIPDTLMFAYMKYPEISRNIMKYPEISVSSRERKTP